MRLALFDLDNTLLAGDSDHAWGEFLCHHGHVDVLTFQKKNDGFFSDYREGTLDIEAYQAFSQAVLSTTPLPVLLSWQTQFMRECIEPMILPAAESLIARHRRQGDQLVIITATHEFITQPIADRLGVTHLIATKCGQKQGRYTGLMDGVPCFQEGKVIRLQEWLVQTHATWQGSTFYSDSRNDLPLLEHVDYPVAVDPDPTLKVVATERGWPVISLR